MGHLDQEWVREAERLQERYVVEVVERFGLCPWAQRARVDGQTRVSVVLATDDTAIPSSVEVLDAWGRDEEVDIGFLVYPRMESRRREFDQFAARLREAAVARHPLGRAPFALAAFHPEGQPDLADAERLVPFLRRTPDACVQAVRMSTLDRVRRGAEGGTKFIDIAALDERLSSSVSTPPLRDRIAAANLETVKRAGLETITACIDAIQVDRVRSYRALEAREATPHAEERAASAPPPSAVE